MFDKLTPMGALAIIGTSFSGDGSVRVMQEAVRIEQNEEG